MEKSLIMRKIVFISSKSMQYLTVLTISSYGENFFAAKRGARGKRGGATPRSDSALAKVHGLRM